MQIPVIHVIQDSFKVQQTRKIQVVLVVTQGIIPQQKLQVALVVHKGGIKGNLTKENVNIVLQGIIPQKKLQVVLVVQ